MSFSWPGSPCRLGTGGLLVAFALALCLGDLHGQQPGKKQPVPSKAAEEKALKLIGELYGPELVKSIQDKEARLKLAQVFLNEGRDTTDDLAARYVLLREAWLLAGQAGDAAIALQALEEMAAGFAVEDAVVLAAKIKALESAVKSASSPENHQFIVDAATVLLEEAVAADEFETALALGVIAENAGKKLKSVPLVSGLRKRNDEVKTLQAEFAPVKPFVAALKKDAKDARANTEVGRYYALTKGNWERGLPLLAKGDDATLKELATLEARAPTAGKDQATLGHKWAAAAATLKEGAARNALLRAYQWLQQALASVPDDQRPGLEKALTSINEKLPPEFRVGEIAVQIRQFDGHTGPVFGSSISYDGSRLVSGGADRTVRLWDGRANKLLRRFDGHDAPVWAVAISPDGRRIASGGYDKTIRFWDPVTGSESKRLGGHDDYVRALALAANGRLLLSGGDDRVLRLWDAATGADLKTLAGHEHFVFGAALSRDGKQALSASLDKTVRLWNLETGKMVKTLSGHKDTVLGVAFSPDGRRALSASTDKTLRLWDLNTGQTIREFKGHPGYVYAAAFSPDGRRALSVGQDGKLHVWNVDTGELLRAVEGHVGAAWSVAFSGDGRFAVTSGQDGTVRLWGSQR